MRGRLHPDLDAANDLLLAGLFIPSALTESKYFEADNVHLIALLVLARQFRCLRFVTFVTYDDARLAT